MKILCIIPARGGSKGIPKKNLIDFCGKPLLQWTIEQAKDSKLISSILVSSNNKEILELAMKCSTGWVVRPERISNDVATSEAALEHAINIFAGYKPDLIVFLQATSPLRTSQDIDNAINELIKNDYDSLFSACEIEDFLIWEKYMDGQLHSVNYDYKSRQRRQEIEKKYVENGSIYVFKPEILLKHNNRLGGKIGMYIMDKWKMHEIDDYESLELCEFLMNKKILEPALPNRIKEIAEQYHERVCGGTLGMSNQKCECCFSKTNTTTVIEHDSRDFSKDLKLCTDCWIKLMSYWQKNHPKKIVPIN